MTVDDPRLRRAAEQFIRMDMARRTGLIQARDIVREHMHGSREVVSELKAIEDRLNRYDL